MSEAHPEPYRCRVRMKFTKQGPVRFLSHLDLLRCVERALRRGRIPVAYTVGFHPRIRISFGPALALGHSSVCEWMDIDMADDVDVNDVARRLSAALPVGCEIQSTRLLESGARALQAAVQRGCYRVVLARDETEPDDLPARIDAFLARQEIPLQKKNKVVNLRAFVHELRISEPTPPTLEMALRVGQEGSVRPEDVLAALYGEPVDTLLIERTALLTLENGVPEEP